MVNFVRISGENIDLCAIRDDDEAIELYTKWMNDEDVLQYFSSVNVTTPAGERKWAAKHSENEDYVFNIVTKKGTLIGNCDISVSNVGVVGGIGIAIGEKDFRGKGYGTEAIRLLLKFGFEELRLNNIHLNVLSYNERAIKCYKKAGLKECGRLHKALWKKGKYIDMIQMEILADRYFKKVKGA